MNISLIIAGIYLSYPLQYNLTICFYKLIWPNVHCYDLFIFEILEPIYIYWKKNLKGEDNIALVLKWFIYFFSHSLKTLQNKNKNSYCNRSRF